MTMARVAVLAPINSIPEEGECEQFLNLSRSCQAATDLANVGVAPFVPGLCAVWHMMTPLPREFWVKWTRSFISACDAVFVVGRSRSGGVEADADFARSLGLPVFTSVSEVSAWAQKRAKDPELSEFILPSYESEIERAREVTSNKARELGLGEFPAEDWSQRRG